MQYHPIRLGNQGNVMSQLLQGERIRRLVLFISQGLCEFGGQILMLADNGPGSIGKIGHLASERSCWSRMELGGRRLHKSYMA